MISRLFSVSNVFTQRCLLNSSPEHSLFKLSEHCLSSDSFKFESASVNDPEIKLKTDKINTFLSPFISNIEANICTTVTSN